MDSGPSKRLQCRDPPLVFTFSQGPIVMVSPQLKIAAGMPILTVMLGGALAYHGWAADSPDRSEAKSSDARKGAPGILADQFDKLRALIKPKPGGYDDVPWMTDLWEARKKAAEEGKPLLVWVGDGHPLGWT